MYRLVFLVVNVVPHQNKLENDNRDRRLGCLGGQWTLQTVVTRLIVCIVGVNPAPGVQHPEGVQISRFVSPAACFAVSTRDQAEISHTKKDHHFFAFDLEASNVR